MKVFAIGEVARALGLDPAQLVAWQGRRVVRPSARRGRRGSFTGYTFCDALALSVAMALRALGMPLPHIRPVARFLQALDLASVEGEVYLIIDRAGPRIGRTLASLDAELAALVVPLHVHLEALRRRLAPPARPPLLLSIPAPCALVTVNQEERR